ncbi:hypothetical protein GQ53DRAFT_869862 [Thozetella sp. PMI_491]|nr:hypothetical protein GQ53DRAFT_869862 [Thozetella sp. PMI_491]
MTGVITTTIRPSKHAEQCMRSEWFSGDPIPHTWNGGYWNYDAQYAEGWFYSLAPNSKREFHEMKNAITKLDGGVVTSNRTIHISFDEQGNITGILHDNQLQRDGSVRNFGV